MTLLNTNDLDLLAFRYIANEMSLEERAAFEIRLADDQAACEAVATAVEMAQALALTVGDLAIGDLTVDELDSAPTPMVVRAQDERGFSQSRAWMFRPAVWMSAGAAACLIAVMISQSWGPDGMRLLTKDSRLAQRRQAEAKGENLAFVWSQVRQLDTVSDIQKDVELLSIGESEYTSLDTEVPVTKAPSWIAAAVSGLSETKDFGRDVEDDVEEL